MKPIVLIHGYSSEGKARKPEEIYGTLPRDLRRLFGRSNVVDINLSRWISLSDGIALDDISFALERALRSNQHKRLLKSGFHVVIHSTGALVVRNWMRLFQGEHKPWPVGNLVHLAGANFGSGLAHVGKGELFRWGRQVFQGIESGVRVLDELEFGASKTLDLHLHFLGDGHDVFEDFGVQEFCAIGSATLNLAWIVPIRYVKEDSSDGVVRTSAGNLNFNHVTVTPTAEGESVSVKDVREEVEKRLENKQVARKWYQVEDSGLAATRRAIPYAVLLDTTHTGNDHAILTGEKARPHVLPRLKDALSMEHDEAAYQQMVIDWDGVTRATLSKIGGRKGRSPLWDIHAQYEGHSQLIFRLRDQFGSDVEHHDIRFKSGGTADQIPLESMIEDVHVNRLNPGTRTYYLRTVKFDKDTGAWNNQLDTVAPLQLEISGAEPLSGDIEYLPLNLQLTSAALAKMIQPFRSTVIDVKLLRLPTEKVFRLKMAG